MKIIKQFLVVVTIIVGWIPSASSAQGSIVDIHLKDHRDVSGELLDVRDSTIVVLTLGANGTVPDSLVLKPKEISVVQIHGRSHIAASIAVGAFLGAVAGSKAAGLQSVAISSGERIVVGSPADEKAYTNAGFAVGAGIGWLFGWMVSQPDKRIDLPTIGHLEGMVSYSRRARIR
ncbi:MAG: hypothetical protein HY562_04565 [Ignavibacteriales bacterium]|nr:hypothetical protein [Ignavibacteriales bacterium]